MGRQPSEGGLPALRMADDVLLREVGGEMVLLHLGSEQYFGLNRMGAEIVTRLTERPWAQALATLEKDYEVDPEVLRRDVQELVDALTASGLIGPLHDGD